MLTNQQQTILMLSIVALVLVGLHIIGNLPQ